MSPLPLPYALIACDVFAEELPFLADQIAGDSGAGDSGHTSDTFQPPWQKMAFLEMGLHDRPDSLRAEVQSLIDTWDADPGFAVIVLAYGLCGNGLVGIQARRKTVILPRAHDCISILLGGTKPHQAILRENPGTYFYSPGWIRAKRIPGPDREPYLRALYTERYPDDPEMVDDLVEADEMAFSHHSCAAYVDITGNAEAKNYCQGCAAHLGWSFRKLPGDASWLRRLLSGDWTGDDFLQVPPGYRVGQAANDHLVVAVKEDAPA